MKNAQFIAVDNFNVIIMQVGGVAGFTATGLTTYAVNFYLSDFHAGKYIYNPETGDYILNPDYETEHAAGKVYYQNTGWAYPEPEEGED